MQMFELIVLPLFLLGLFKPRTEFSFLTKFYVASFSLLKQKTKS